MEFPVNSFLCSALVPDDVSGDFFLFSDKLPEKVSGEPFCSLFCFYSEIRM